MHQKFNTNKQYLSSKIFIPQPPQQGQVWTNLNITVLPDYLIYIKNQLTKQEQMIISDYHLQTYLLETALKPHPKNDFDACTNQIIQHLRSHTQFWVRKIGSQQEKMRMHLAIQDYHKDCQALEKEFNQQSQMRLEGIKIIQDYTYEGNVYTKGAHRFTAVIYPWFVQYIVDNKYKQQLQKIQNSQKQITQLKSFILQFLCQIASKSRPKPRLYEQKLGNSQQDTINQIQASLKQFIKYLEDNNVDTRCLSNMKDYYVIANCLFIVQKFVSKYIGTKLDCQKKEMEMEMQMQNQGQKQKENQTKNQANNVEKIEQILADCVNKFVKKQDMQLIVEWLLKGQYSKICILVQLRNQCENQSKQKWRGLISSQAQLQAAFQTYNQIMNHPENTNRMKYKLEGSEVGWTDQKYLKFLQSFLQFFNVPTNNKRIAQAMGKDIEPNHVKHVKGLYMRNMNTRIDNGQIGGGKKGTFQSKIQFLKKDIQTFNMKWFKKQKKNKTKKIRRKRRRQTFDQQQQDSDY